MRVTVESRAGRGVKLLPEIPDLTPCLIEGRNGIGKTLTVRLLELVGGKQPFRSEEEWQSLRNRLGDSEVTLTQLRDGRTLTFRFTPGEWPSGPTELVRSQLGVATLDGRRVDNERVGDLLWVERIAGNEDLNRTLQRRLEFYARQTGVLDRKIADSVAALQELMAPAIEALESLDTARIDSDRRRLGEAEEHEQEARDAHRAAVDRHERTLSALRARDGLHDARTKAEEWRAASEALAQRLTDLDDERARLQKAYDQTAAEVKRSGGVQEELAESRRILRYREKRHRNIESDIARIEKALGMEAPNDETVAEALRHGRETLAALESRRRKLDATGATLKVIERLDGLLQGAVDDGLGDQVIMRHDKSEISVKQARAGLDARARELSSQPPPDELRSLSRAVLRERVALSRLQDLLGRLRERGRQQELLEEAAAAVASAEAHAAKAGGQDEAFKELSLKLAANDAEADAVAREQSDLLASLGLEGGQSAEDAADYLERALKELGLSSEDDLGDAERMARVDVERRIAVVEQTSAHAGALRRTVTLLQAAAETATTSLMESPAARWIGRLAGTEEALLDPTRRLEALVGLRESLEAVGGRLEQARNLVSGLQHATANVFERREREGILVSPVRAVLNDELREALDRPAIRDLVFDGADLVGVDALARTLTLRGREGEDDVRAFDTFSTGEQAFAFTQARVLELEPSDRPNRLLVLDEFGAFVAADRLPELARFLTSERVAEVADQVLVILPLQTEYEREVSQTTGTLHDRYAERAAQVAERGYCAVAFTP